MYSDLILFLACLGVGQAFVMLPTVQRALRRIAAERGIHRAVIGLIVGSALYVGGTKGPAVTDQVAQFVTVLRSGVMIDESGVIAKATDEATIQAYITYSTAITAAASNTVINAQSEFDRVAGIVTNSTRNVIYIASFLPRSGTGGSVLTNHNISATVEQVRQTSPTNLSAWVWYTEAPQVAPTITADVNVGAGAFAITSITNSFPDTETINGVPCVRYDFGIPESVSGVPFLPAYEVAFGTVDAPLIVPVAGVSVETNGVVCLPFTGTDTNYFGGRVSMKYAGGIAIELSIDDVVHTNGVYQL